MTFTKLIVHPAVAWGFAVLLMLPPWMVGATVLPAALPTGTGPFMLAELYERDAEVTSRTILITTLLSVLSIAALLRLMGF